MDKIKDKIKKLLALQKSAEEIGSLEEAQNAAGQISKLLMKYNLELSDIEDEVEKEFLVNGIKLHEILPYNKSHGRWLSSLYHIIAMHNFCSTVSWKTANPNDCIIEIWGEEYNVEVVKDLAFNYATQIIKLEKQRWKEFGESMGEKRNAFRRGYYVGANNGLYSVLSNKQKEVVAEHGESALMIINNTLAKIDELQKQVHDDLKDRRKASYSASNAGALGYEDGKNLKGRRSLNDGRLLE